MKWNPDEVLCKHEGHDITRGHFVLLALLHSMDELRKKGMVDGGFRLNDRGREKYAYLQSLGFVATDQQVIDMLPLLLDYAENGDIEPTTPGGE
jgi:hypothetical protein